MSERDGVSCDHVALVVTDLERALARCRARGWASGPVEEFPGEGTREVYVGGEGRSARLLLMQPLGQEGPYARALARRGPGVHHLALHVTRQLTEAVTGFPGFYLHPVSLTTAARGTAWLTRPGVGGLVELHTVSAPLAGGEPFVHGLELAAPAESPALLEALSTPRCPVARAAGAPRLRVDGAWVGIDSLC